MATDTLIKAASISGVTIPDSTLARARFGQVA